MKLDNKNSISIYGAGRLRKFNAKQDSYPQNSNPRMHNTLDFSKTNDINFTGDFTKVIDKTAKKITYSNIGEISAKIDDVLGDGYFSKAIEKAGLTVADNKLQLPNNGFLYDFIHTVKYPFLDMPRDIINSFAKGLKKFHCDKLSENIQKIKILSDRAKVQNKEKNIELVSDILENFANRKTGDKITNGLNFNLENCAQQFKEKAAENVTKLAKNYNSRDERTLNRIATATVSSLYGMWDFHNISMLQKDDIKEAKKSGKSRFKQEMTRMAFNAGTTFITMGALNKYIKNSMALSVGAIAISALLSEVVSRILNKKPLHPLSPKEAEQIALKQKPELAESIKISNNKEANDRVIFKQRLEDTNRIFVQFQSKDGRFPAMKCLDDDYASGKSKDKKKVSVKNIILGAFGIASAAYLATTYLKGDFKYKNQIRKLYKENGENIPEDLIKNLLSDKKNTKGIFEKFSPYKTVSEFLNNAKKIITTKRKTVDLTDLSKKLGELKETPKGEEIKNILDDYIDKLSNIRDEQGNTLTKLTVRKQSIIRNGLYNGFSRLFDNIYTILSLPGRLIDNLILDKTIFAKSNKAAEKIEAKLPKKVNMEKIVASLYDITRKAKNDNDMAEQISKSVRKFESGPETGKLASLARTLVTAISTYFFVNDYTNSVLIESAGKDTQRAKEERNERLAHKGANFVINGTLMNLFNSIFVKPLNRSLIGATLVATATETTNEFLVRKSICQPVLPKNSKQEIIDFEEKQLSKKGVMGAWTRLFKKVTGKKSLTQKTGIGNDKKVK